MRLPGSLHKYSDLLALVLLAILGAWGSIALSLDFLSSTLLFYVPPIVYLLVRKRARLQRRRLTAMFAVFGLLYGFLFAYIANLGKAWKWPVTNHVLQNVLLLGVVPVTDVIWVALWVFYIVLFYEHFLEHDRRDVVGKLFSLAWMPGLAVFALIIFSSFFAPALFAWPYAYFFLGLLTLPPCVYLLCKKPMLLTKILVPSLFFVPLHLLIELVGLHLDHWRFTGEYLATVHFLGGGMVPIEEFVTWILLGAFITICYYELYIDDMK